KNLWIPIYVPLPTQEERFFEKEINGDRLIMALPSPDQTFPPVQRVAIKRVIPCPKLFFHKSNPLFYPPQLFGLIRIPGIGLLTAMVLLTEIGDVNRFKGLNELAAYLGLIPNCHDSGETKRVGSNTKRGNVYLKYILIEASWMCLRYDPSMLLAYKSAVRKMDSNKAIIKVAVNCLTGYGWFLKIKGLIRSINEGLKKT